MNRSFCAFLGVVALAAGIVPARAANPFLQPLFSNDMVLQRDASDPVWGWTTPGATVTVTVNDQNGAAAQTKTATAGSDGRWQVVVGPFSVVPNNAAYSMSVSASSGQTATVSDILIGDVWMCSGQSNMEYTLIGNYGGPGQQGGGTRLSNSSNEITAAASYTYIRQFKASRGTVAATPQATFIGGVDYNGWTTAANDSQDFSAVGFFMAKQIYLNTQVPIGLLNLTWGGTDIPPWIAPETLRTIADYTPTVDAISADKNPSNTQPTEIYNAMVAPAVGFNIKGAAWLQGENSSTTQTEQRYIALLSALRSGLRLKFNNSNLPFIVVQICTGDVAQTVPVEDASGSYYHYNDIRDAQLRAALADGYSRVVGSLDCGYVPTPSGTFQSEVHNIDKQDVGKRAGQAALNVAYGVTSAYLSPTFDHATISGNTIQCFFNNVGSGLMTGVIPPPDLAQNAPPSPSPVQQTTGVAIPAFAIAGADKTFYNATATLNTANNTVSLTSASVPSPLYVRYGAGSNPWNTANNRSSLNLYRKITDTNGNVTDGAPVLPFRNDLLSQLNVNSGSGSGLFSPGAQTGVSATAAPSGQSFAFWSGDTSTLASTTSATTTATLSQSYVSLRPVYQLNAAPTGLTGTAGNLSVALTWNALANASSYSIKRASSANGTYTTLASGLLTTSYTDNASGFGQPQFYVVSATDAAGESPNSAAISVTPLAPGAPIVTGAAGNTVACLSWSPVANATGYKVSRSTTNGGPYNTVLVSSTPGTFYNDNNLQNGTTYYYVVYTLFNGSPSAASAQVTITPTSSTTPLTRSTGGTASGTSYQYDSTTQQPGSAFDGNTSTKWFGTVASLSASTPAVLQYQFGGGAAWNITQYQIATANDQQVRDPATWLFQGSNDGANWTTLDSRTGQTLGSARTTYTPAYTFSNSSVYGSYRFVVTATYGTGGGGCQLSEFVLSSSPTDAGDKTPPVLTLPANITAQPTSSAGATVSFQPTAADAVNGTLVPVCTPASGSVFPIGTTTVQCSAIDGSGNTATGSFTVTVNGPPAAPGGVSAAAYDGRVNLSWNAVAGATSYTVQRSLSSSGGYATLASGLGSAGYSDTTAADGTTYYYMILAVNGAGSGGASSAVSGTPIGQAQIISPKIALANGTAQMSLATSISGRTYQLQRSYTLVVPSWINLGAVQSGGGPLNFSDNPDPNQHSAFYRLLIGP